MRASRKMWHENVKDGASLDIELGLCSTNSLSGKRRGLTIAFDQLAARLPIMKSIPKSASLQ
jgi:hypothetical protein